jgi:hypothetical protein
LRYPSDLTNEEWALAEPLIPPAGASAPSEFDGGVGRLSGARNRETSHDAEIRVFQHYLRIALVH